jgi:hypothetical protein
VWDGPAPFEPPVDNQADLVRAAGVEVVADELFEEPMMCAPALVGEPSTRSWAVPEFGVDNGYRLRDHHDVALGWHVDGE